MEKAKLRRLTFLSMIIALGVVLSPILRVPGMAPMQHFINVICSVFLGPKYAFVCALAIAFLRMALFGINLLALTGAIFGALLAGIFYNMTKKILAAVIGEIIGTGIIGALVSYPVMAFIYGNGDVALFTYIPSFLAGTFIGGFLALLFLKILEKQGLVEKIQKKLWEN